MRRTARIAAIAGLGAALLAGTGAQAAPATQAPAQHVQAQHVQAQHAKPSPKTIAHLLRQWDAALATGNPGKVADRYAADAVLLPTLSNQVRTDRAGLIDYFTHFLRNKPRAVVKESHVNVLDANTAVDAGVYVITLTENGAQRKVEARYTFVYELRGGKWLIVSHHSSLMPEQAGAH